MKQPQNTINPLTESPDTWIRAARYKLELIEMGASIEFLRSLRNEVQAELDEAMKAHELYAKVCGLDAAIADLEKSEAPARSKVAAMKPFYEKRDAVTPTTTMGTEAMAEYCVAQAGEPLRFGEIFDFINGAKRYPDLKRARMNVASMISKGSRLEAVHWRGYSAWWLKGKPLPIDLSPAGTSSL